MKSTIGEYIHKMRTEEGLTLTKLAAALDLDQSTLSKIENNKRNLPPEALPKLAKTFKLDLKELEKEFYSEKIAEILYRQPDTSDLLILAEEKAKYLKSKNSRQANLNL